ncbi:S-adenosyl-L-methionine-dependent methyltransferase [Rhizophagus irregularis]|uniref:S-adenosyl-L-methionine-dependent methyltransferase n=1 Tax=Rhizophagus irregularis TaxID=588596 RepID=A0A2N1NPV3_9GLOM|nr:S-adenosyl-L-methionine-dependent methyltransferase [Rhizophagus irregularis]
MSRDQKITKYPLYPLYPFPKNDLELEQDAKCSKLLHELMKKVWGGNFVSPIEQELKNKKDFKVLDVGCGTTCSWILELSKTYPVAKFIGLDLLTPLLPKDFSQNNLQFVQSDILKGLPFEDGSIDFVHMRCLTAAFTERQWEEVVIKELVRVCKPGGWIELLEIDVDGKSLGPTSKRIISACMAKFENRGVNGLISEEIPEFFESTNQVEIYAEEKYSPIGNWGDELGKLALDFFVSIFSSSDELIEWIKVSKEEYEHMIAQYIKEVEIYRSYFINIKFYCQKITS